MTLPNEKPMHYNHFTIDYIESIKRNLNIYLDDYGRANFFRDTISEENILNLSKDLETIWGRSSSSIKIIKEKHDAKVQSGLFGLVNDLEQAVKIGFLLGDRVVIIDYLFERILQRNNPSDINITHLGAICTYLVSLLPLAKKGRVVIIPNPLIWHDQTKQVMLEVSQKTILSPNLMSLLNMLSITRLCQLHPYTIAESDDVYQDIINTQIDNADVIGKDAATYAYEGIVAGLLSEKLVNRTEFTGFDDLPIEQFYETVSNHDGFNRAFIERIISGGSLNAEQNIEKLISDLKSNQGDNSVLDFKKPIANTMSIVGGTISLASTLYTISAPLIATGALLGLSSTLVDLIPSKEGNDQDIVISLLSKFYKN